MTGLAGIHKVVLGLLVRYSVINQFSAVLYAEDDLVVVVLHLPVEVGVLFVSRGPIVIAIMGGTLLIGIGVSIFL